MRALLLQQVIVQKTAEELKKQQEREAEERQRTVASRVPQLSIDGLDQGNLLISGVTRGVGVRG